MTAAARRIPVLVGIDLGSTRTKVGLITPDGVPVAFARAGHTTDVDPSTGRAEQDPEAWWAGLGSATRAAVTRDADAGQLDVLGVCVTGHGPTLTAVDATGRPTRPAITWLDTRARDEQVEFERATSLRGWALGVLPAARWLERHDPESASRTSWYLNSWEALALRLCGRAATTMVPGGSPLPIDAAESLGLDTRRIAPELGTGTILGGLLPDAASHLGLPSGTPVVAGLVDAFASFHGARMLGPGDAIDVGGAAGGFGVYSDREIHVTGGFTTPAPLRGMYSVGGAMAATGASLDWFARDVLGGVAATSDLITEVRGIAPGADGLVFLPYLAGERSPLWDPHARGAFVGLTLRHTRAHMTRAILEAAALAIRNVAEPILQAGIEVTAMRACGGPARSDLWNQIKADVTGFAIEVPRARETAAVGATIVAAVGVGAHDDLPSAIRSMTAIDRRFAPRDEGVETYERVYQAYVSLYPALAPIMHKLQSDATGVPAAVTV